MTLRLITHNDGPEEIRTGATDPRLVAVSVVQDAIERSLRPVEGQHCVNCYSTHLRNRSTVTTRGQLLCSQRCSDCGHLQNAEIDV